MLLGNVRTPLPCVKRIKRCEEKKGRKSVWLRILLFLNEIFKKMRVIQRLGMTKQECNDPATPEHIEVFVRVEVFDFRFSSGYPEYLV